MLSNLDKYTLEVKSKLDKNYLSPLFIRLANLLYVNEQYEECIAVCKTGLEIYPRYLTAKLILLKAFLKAEYLNEAEILFKEVKSKMTNQEQLNKFRNNIQTLRTISKQEKIYYSKTGKSKSDYKFFEKKFHPQENLFSEFTLNDLFDENAEGKFSDDKQFQNFLVQFDSFHFDNNPIPLSKSPDAPVKKQTGPADTNDLLNKIKIVTETLADIYAEQGNLKEAFDAYNILLRAGSNNSRRIEEKINELERNMLKEK